MAELGLFDVTVFKDKNASDTAQVPATSISVLVYREGAWANGNTNSPLSALQVGATISVHDSGSFAVNDFVTVDTDNGSTMKAKVTALTATQLTVDEVLNNTSFAWSDASRIVNLGASTLTLNSDDQAVETKTNALTTDGTSGYAWAYTAQESVDYLVSGTGVTTTLFNDYPIHRPNIMISNMQDGASAIGFTVDTTNTFSTSGSKILSLQTGGTEEFYVTFAGDVWTDSGVFVSDVADGASADVFVFDADNAFTTSGAKLASFTNNSTEKFFIDKDGGFTAAEASTITTGGLTISGGGVAVTGNSTIAGTLGSLTGLTVDSGGLTVTAGDIKNDTGKLTSSVANGSSAVGTELDTDEAFSTDGARLLSVRNNNTEKFALDHAGRPIAKGTALVTGDVALSAGWGNTASVSGVAGTDFSGMIQIASAGTGQGASPTATLTFTDGGLPGSASAVCIVSRRSGAQLTVGFSVSCGNTTAVFTFDGTPVDTETYELEFIVVGL